MVLCINTPEIYIGLHGFSLVGLKIGLVPHNFYIVKHTFKSHMPSYASRFMSIVCYSELQWLFIQAFLKASFRVSSKSYKVARRHAVTGCCNPRQERFLVGKQ